MLVLARKVGEQIVINGNIQITLTEAKNGKAKIGIVAPKDVRVDRMEIHEKNKTEDTTKCQILVDTQKLEKLKVCRIIKALKPNGEELNYGIGWLAKVLKISKSKIKIHMGESFEPRTLLTIGFGKNHQLAALIYKSEKQENNSCVIEAEFNSHLTEKELELVYQ